jgi:hypothetical protein
MTLLRPGMIARYKLPDGSTYVLDVESTLTADARMDAPRLPSNQPLKQLPKRPK